MSDESPPPPLADDIADLIGAVRDVEPMPGVVRDRLRARLEIPAIGVPPTPPQGPSTSPVARSPVTAMSRASAFLRHPLRLGAMAFVLGGAAGAGLHAGLAGPSSPRTVVVVRTVEVPARPVAPTPPAAAMPPAITAPAAIPAVAAPTASEAPPRPTPSRTVEAQPDDDASLRAEQRVLDMARTALTRGQYAAALDALEGDARRFAHGQLAEERDSMTVQALIGAARYDDARARAARFSREYPRSLLRPAVESAVRTIP